MLPLPASGRGPGVGLNPPTPAGLTPPPTPPRSGEGSKARPPARFVVCGQRVDEVKVARARDLRRQMTPAESALWNRLRYDRLLGLRFRRQQVIDGFIADFYCHAVGLVVEVDGAVHDLHPEYDAERDRLFAARGLAVLRLRNQTVFQDLAGDVALIERVCRQRLTALGLPLPEAGRGRKTRRLRRTPK
ncbi:MAG: DUF559 domain-containing protein [Gemmataceae bacterium]